MTQTIRTRRTYSVPATQAIPNSRLSDSATLLRLQARASAILTQIKNAKPSENAELYRRLKKANDAYFTARRVL